MAAVTVGANLKPFIAPEARRLSLSLVEFIQKMQLTALTAAAAKTLYASRNDMRVFTKEGAPATNTSADSPGQDLCFVIDITNNDLYLIYAWSAASTFTSVKILD
jgi:hypothetical protein